MTRVLLNAAAWSFARRGRVLLGRRFGAGLMLAAAGIRPAMATDLDTVTQRLTAQFIGQDPSDSTVQGYMSSLQSNGSWSDINYSNTSQTNWTPATHLTRMMSMSESYSNSSSSLYNSSTLQADILNAYNYWISVDPHSTNWYDNDIRTPEDLGATMVLMKSQLSASELSSGNTILNRADAELSVPSIATGSNLVLLATVGIDQGVVDASTADVSQGFSEIQSTISVVSPGPGEGIEPDHSYQFHGPQLYMGDYGLTALVDPLQYASIGAGTSFAISNTQEQILVDTLLDGSQWFIYGKALDFTSSGRDASRQGFGTEGTGYLSAVNYALSLGTYRTSELQAFAARQQASINSGTANAAEGLTGNRDFYDSDIMVQQRPGYYESAKVTSTRTVNPESINGENLKGLYMADGVNQIMVTGQEYNNIEPVFNWQRLPGTTVEQNSRSLQPGSADRGATNFAGGVSDGMYGAEALSYNRFDVVAQKSWFFFGNEEAALGAAINAPNAASEVDTTLNQCLLTSTVTYETTASSTHQTLSSGTVTPAGLKWVYQGGVGYFFINPVSNATIEAMSQSGTWQSINSQYSSSNVSANVFTLYIDHGAHASNGSYAYIEVPDMTAAGMDAYEAANPIQVLRNDATVQAIRESTEDITQAAFYSASSFAIVPGQTLAANSPSMVMLQRQPDVLKLAGSSPQNLQFPLQLQLSGVTLSGSSSSWFDAMGTATAVLNLPGGNSAGQTIGMTLSSDGGTMPTVSLSNTTGSAALSYTVTAAVALPNNTTFSTDANSTLGFSAPISGTGSLTKSGVGTLVLSGTNTYGGGTNINGGTLQVGNAGVTGSLGAGTVTDNANLKFDVAGPLAVNSAIAGTGALTQAGAGTVVLNGHNSFSGAVAVNQGVLQLGAGTGGETWSALSISAGGSLDLNNNHIVINYGSGPDPIASIAAWIASGYAAGTWSGTGIMSSAAQANSGSYGIGYADAADPGNPAGLASGQIEIMYTLLGDANLDGTVNGSDFAILATNFNKAASGWDSGDFNYDGSVNGSDFALLAANFNKGASGAADQPALDSFAAANGISADVPEPLGLGMVLAGGVGLILRRRKRAGKLVR